MFDSNMLAWLICPMSHLPLNFDAEGQYLVSEDGRYRWPVINGIPVFIPDVETGSPHE